MERGLTSNPPPPDYPSPLWILPTLVRRARLPTAHVPMVDQFDPEAELCDQWRARAPDDDHLYSGKSGDPEGKNISR